MDGEPTLTQIYGTVCAIEERLRGLRCNEHAEAIAALQTDARAGPNCSANGELKRSKALLLRRIAPVAPWVLTLLALVLAAIFGLQPRAAPAAAPPAPAITTPAK